VARDGTGFCVARCKIYEGIIDPMIIEALAFRNGCVLGVDKGFRGTQCGASFVGFFCFNIVFARHKANQMAHNTAKFGCLQGESFSWDAEPPDC
jgi:hypothetical protein